MLGHVSPRRTVQAAAEGRYQGQHHLAQQQGSGSVSAPDGSLAIEGLLVPDYPPFLQINTGEG